jgi:hypothetical protein
VLNILANHKEDTRSQLLSGGLGILENNSIFGDRKDKISTYVVFLKKYFNTTVQIKYGDTTFHRKAKGKMDQQTPKESIPLKGSSKAEWCKLQPGWVKINIGASFIAEIVLNGAPLFVIVMANQSSPSLSAWSPNDRCSGATEVEVAAALEGLRIAANLNVPTIMESNYQYMVDCLSNHVLDISHACFIVDEALSC